ncbi:MAG: redox-regulated ATPase YchF [Candidatus Margulisiibacteriota bacterium]|mgnify:CR=1 FL=1
MSLSVGIVGLPNVGKSTLFSAITNTQVDAQNYPFCTIEPNIGIVAVVDPRVDKLADLHPSEKKLYATIEFVDIAGLVKGASKGEGLGNQFLTNIRQTAVIAHVVRCFADDNIIHVSGTVDPKDDIEVINLELIYADLQTAEKALDQQKKKAKTVKEEAAKATVLEKVVAHLGSGLPVRSMRLTPEEWALIRDYQFLSAKKMIYVANVAEHELQNCPSTVDQVREIAAKTGDPVLVISSKLEQELSSLSPEEKQQYLAELGITQSGLDQLSRACYDLLGLQTYLTVGPKEARAWTIHKGDTAPKAAGVIHTDFEKGFIRANVVSFTDLMATGSLKAAREKGLLRQEGKDYVMQDGDVVEFLFNV